MVQNCRFLQKKISDWKRKPSLSSLSINSICLFQVVLKKNFYWNCQSVKSTVKISSIFVAFLENINFTTTKEKLKAYCPKIYIVPCSVVEWPLLWPLRCFQPIAAFWPLGHNSRVLAFPFKWNISYFFSFSGNLYITQGYFEAFLNHPPTYVRTFSLHKVRENCHFLDHPPT